jgi:hypothetical protein
MRHLLAVVTLISLAPIGCDVDGQSASTDQNSSEAVEPVSLPDDETGARVGASYSVLDETTVPGSKRSLDVRLDQKVSEETLREIALELKGSASQNYDRTFIAYYLPDMTVGAGAWATTHFTPDLEVRILGLTAEEEQTLKVEAATGHGEVLGSWLDERPFVGNKFTIFRQGGALFIQQAFKDGSGRQIEVAESDSPLGRRYDKIESSSTGDHWVVGADGDLQIRDNEGLIATAKKIQ